MLPGRRAGGWVGERNVRAGAPRRAGASAGSRRRGRPLHSLLRRRRGPLGGRSGAKRGRCPSSRPPWLQERRRRRGGMVRPGESRLQHQGRRASDAAPTAEHEQRGAAAELPPPTRRPAAPAAQAQASPLAPLIRCAECAVTRISSPAKDPCPRRHRAQRPSRRPQATAVHRVHRLPSPLRVANGHVLHFCRVQE